MFQRIFNFVKRHKALFCSIIIGIVLATTSCFVIHKEEFDLTVYKEMIDIMDTLNTKDLINYICQRGEIISMTYFYLMGCLGLEGYIQVLPTFIFYFIFFYILIDYCEVKKYKKRNLFIIIILFLSLFKYMDIAACIRNNLAFSVFLLGYYLEGVKKKKKTAYIMYIISCFIHTSLWAILILKELLRIKNKKVVIGLMAIIFLIIVFPQILVYLFDNTNMVFFEILSDKIEVYLLDAIMYPNIQYLFRIMQLITLAIFSIYSIYKYKNEEKILNTFPVIIFVITLCLINKYWIFLRFVDLSLFMSLIPIMTLLEKMPNNIFKKVLYLGIILMVIVGIRIQIPTFIKMFIEKGE